MSKKRNKEWLISMDEEVPSTHEESGEANALQGHKTIESWERANGRGFWGNATTGYHYDKDVNGN